MMDGREVYSSFLCIIRLFVKKTKTMIQIGDTHEVVFSITQEQVNTFAQISGDQNPVHIDPEYAAQTSFKKPVVHGIFGSSIFSRILGMEFPGPGTVYLKQQLDFRRPLFPDTEYKATVKVAEVFESRHIARLETTVVDVARGKPHITGEATVMNAEKI